MIAINSALNQPLLDWYESSKRSLPWRETNDPYYIWISEIMLQQTRVEAVIPYYQRFIQTLPIINDLANANEDTLHKLWEGLGYYSRVRNMQAAAKRCVLEHQGHLPQTYDELLALPGIGPYTAGAIASIAFQQSVAAVDGNVLRVFTRLTICEDDILKEATKRKFKALIEAQLPKARVGAYNQAIMELGATICIPNGAPRCNICPIQPYCKGYETGLAQRLPNKTQAKPRRIEKRTILVIVSHSKVLLFKRPDTGLLASLYEFMNIEGQLSIKACKQLPYLQKQDVKIKKLAAAKHIFSHIEWHMVGYRIELAQPIEIPGGIWVDLTQIATDFPIATALQAYRNPLLEEAPHG
ncbi:MAG: A/G-specific adenine glycosylase [Erysipelotrichaceae bacterium]